MATVGEGLKANILIGGTIDANWRNSVGQIKEGLLGITKETTALKNRQAKLAQQMKKAVLEGKDITKLRSEYETLGKKIGDAKKDQGRLNSQLKKAETFSKWMSHGKPSNGFWLFLEYGAAQSAGGEFLPDYTITQDMVSDWSYLEGDRGSDSSGGDKKAKALTMKSGRSGSLQIKRPAAV
ncbi:hypothetical protein [Citrobacter sp. CtB7.12]|uniref:hypothetical protein n=1 Tax=Citrobacter sp. CtB7.12 TaxID=1696093 RepID=UPI0006BA5E68|nr:hypothetical protein [Citrobacter sp. CtB7.12]